MRKTGSTMHPMLALLMLLPATGCVTSPPIIADKAPCSTLVPATLRDAVPGAPAPARADRTTHPELAGYLDAVAREWQKFGVAQTGQLAIANDEKATAIGVIERCEARDRAAIDKARPRFLGIF